MNKFFTEMLRFRNWVGFKTIILREIKRVLRVWVQTLLPAIITTILYFIIFGNIIGSKVGKMGGHSYVQFIAPGLIMMQIISSSYAATVSSFFSAKFQRNIEEILVSPLPTIFILLGYMAGGMIRGLMVGVMITLITLFFTHLHIHSIMILIFITLLTICLFSLAGLINAIYAKKFDDISIIPTFFLTPLIYLGGVFYSISMLPTFWQYLSLANPIVYIINTFRYGFLGVSDNTLIFSFTALILFTSALFLYAYYLLSRGIGLRE